MKMSDVRRAIAGKAWKRVGAAEDGASSVEFAILAPILGFLLIGAVDLGSAVSQRISMGHLMRSGAQVAMEDPGAAKVESVLMSTASENFTIARASSDTISVGDDPIKLVVERVCACPDSPEVSEPDCSKVCTGTVPTFIFYKISAAKKFSGVLMRGLPLQADAHVQVR
jgi:pilus assembly protein CpaE